MIAVVFALEFESAGFRAMQARGLCSQVWTLGVTGERAANALQRFLANQKPSVVLSAGFSGGLQPGLRIGDLIIGRNYTDSGLLQQLGTQTRFLIGDIVTAREILETSVQKLEMGRKTGALAGDLESAHLQTVCQAAGVPMLSVRSISDTAEADLPLPAQVLVNPQTGRSDPSLIFQYLFRHPSKAAQFAALVRDARTAQRSLGAALHDIVLPCLLRPGRGPRCA